MTELIQGFAIARTLETTEAELMETGFPAPDPVRNDARVECLTAYGRALHF